MPSLTSHFFSRPRLVITTSILFRLVLLIYGRWQDAHSPIKYTDIDYLVFTDAARFVARGRSPYDRATYRYTPLLAWLLYPTSWGGWWFEFGKALFATGDIVTGWLIFVILWRNGSSRDGKNVMSAERSMKFASIWLLNPMVANISTRGSSEGLVAVVVAAMLWAILRRRIMLAGALLGLGVHFKIYPFIYAASIFWWLSPRNAGSMRRAGSTAPTAHMGKVFLGFFSYERVMLALSSFLVFMGLNGVMLYK
jgi:GPI mannosyltransferase 1 subunit M